MVVQRTGPVDLDDSSFPDSSEEELEEVAIEPTEIEPVDSKEVELKDHLQVNSDAPLQERLIEVIKTVGPLGFVSFGGTEVHMKIFKKRLVDQRGWLDEEAFEEFVGMAEGIPGPTSSQLLLAATSMYAGPWGGLLAMLLFNLPSVCFMIFAGMMIKEFVDPTKAPWFLAGLPAGALGLLFKSFHSYAEDLDKIEYTILLIAATVNVLVDNDENIDPKSSRWLLPTVLACAGLFCFFDSRRDQPWADYGKPKKGWNVEGTKNLKRLGITTYVGGIILSILGILLAIMFILRYGTDNNSENLDTFETTSRIGTVAMVDESSIFPLFQNEIITSYRNKENDFGSYRGINVDEVDFGWMLSNDFLQGLGLSYLIPGSIYNVGAYFGALNNGIPGALLGIVGLFGPGVAILYGVSPFWDELRGAADFRAISKGMNAASIGFMCSACITLFQTIIIDSTESIIFVFTGALNFVFGLSVPTSLVAGIAVGALLHPNAIDLGQTPYCVDQGFLPESYNLLLRTVGATSGGKGSKRSGDPSKDANDVFPTFAPTFAPAPAAQRIFASNAAAGDSFGEAVALAGDFAIIGASNTAENGLAYILQRPSNRRLQGNSRAWTQTSILTTLDPENNGSFGSAVDISAEGVAVIGDPTREEGGRVFVFTFVEDIWTLSFELRHTNSTPGDRFGHSVAIEGTRVVVGAPGSTFSDIQGKVYIFDLALASEFTMNETAIIVPDEGSVEDFGHAVDISGDLVIVGTDGPDVAYIFETVDDGFFWFQLQKLVVTVDGSGFGSAVSIDGNSAIVGASGDNVAYIYEGSSNWFITATLKPTSGDQDFDEFGYAVSISGNRTVVGAWYRTYTVNTAEWAEVFELDATGSWVETRRVSPPFTTDEFGNEITNAEEFGSAVAISGTDILIGAPADDNFARNAGAAYTFDLTQ